MYISVVVVPASPRENHAIMFYLVTANPFSLSINDTMWLKMRGTIYDLCLHFLQIDSAIWEHDAEIKEATSFLPIFLLPSSFLCGGFVV